MILFFIAFLLNFAFVPIILKFAKKNNLIDKPDNRKQNSQTRIRLGGISLFIATLISYFSYSFFNSINPNLFVSNLNIFFIASLIIFCFGIADDIFELSPQTCVGLNFYH